MSGHSKWSTIKHKKWAKDAQRGKIFWKHAKLIEIASRWWSDPETNSALLIAIENAKWENVPNDNIQRAIKKGSWEWKNAANYEDIVYEWYLPWWSAIIIEVLTDNKNRAVANVRTAITKNWWNMWENWSVSWMFDKKWEIDIDLEWKDVEEFELCILESWADDFEISDDKLNASIYTNAKNLWTVRNYISKAWYNISKAALSWVPNQTVEVDNEKKAEQILRITDALENDDDVSDIYTNFDLSDEIIVKLWM